MFDLTLKTYVQRRHRYNNPVLVLFYTSKIYLLSENSKEIESILIHCMLDVNDVKIVSRLFIIDQTVIFDQNDSKLE